MSFVSKLHDFGIEVGEPTVCEEALFARPAKVIEQLSRGISGLLQQAKVEVYSGEAKFTSSNSVEVNGQNLRAGKIILATGSAPIDLPFLPADGNLIWNYKHTIDNNFLPKSLLIVGSGAIGMEFASFYKRMGSNVTVIEQRGQVLSLEDEEISQFVRKKFEALGVKIYTSAKLEEFELKQHEVSVKINNNWERFDRVITAVGVRANLQGLNLENTKIKLNDSGFVKVDARFKTDDDSIYAIGDVVGPPCLAHKSIHQAIFCANSLGGLIKKDYNYFIPNCTYTNPQIASIGLTQKQAESTGQQIKVGKFEFSHNGKAVATGVAEGLIKVIFSATSGELLGAHMVGADVTELISIFTMAKQLELTDQDLLEVIFPHPTLCEAIAEAVMAANDGAIH